MIRTALAVAAFFGIVVAIVTLSGVPLLVLVTALALIGVGGVIIETADNYRPPPKVTYIPIEEIDDPVLRRTAIEIREAGGMKAWADDLRAKIEDDEIERRRTR